MAYNPPDAEWYLADIVLKFKIKDALESRVWINTRLLRVDPSDVHAK